MSRHGEIVYSIKYRPSRYYLVEMEAPGGLRYTAIAETETQRPVAFAFDATEAPMLCFALDYTRAVLEGDMTEQRRLMKLIERMRQ